MEKLYYQIPLSRLCYMFIKPYFDILSKSLKPHGVEKTISVLIIIQEQKICCQQYISNVLNIDKTTMVKIIDELLKKKYIRKIQNPKDRRENLVTLTDKGKSIVSKAKKDIHNLNKHTFKNISLKDREKFIQTLIVLQNNLKAIQSKK